MIQLLPGTNNPGLVGSSVATLLITTPRSRRCFGTTQITRSDVMIRYGAHRLVSKTFVCCRQVTPLFSQCHNWIRPCICNYLCVKKNLNGAAAFLSSSRKGPVFLCLCILTCLKVVYSSRRDGEKDSVVPDLSLGEC